MADFYHTDRNKLSQSTITDIVHAGFSPDYRVQILPVLVAETMGNPPLVTLGEDFLMEE